MSTPPDSLLDSIQQLQRDYENKLPPVEKWTPDCNGDLDMRIDREGQWYYQGGKIERQSMVKMFSSILKREGDDYFLVTPVEKWRIQVDQAPFVFVGLRLEQQGEHQGLVLTTNTGHEVLLSEANPLEVSHADSGEPRPMATVYRNLPGLINRNVFYELVELSELETDEQGREWMRVHSAGNWFRLGQI
jgi:hypothetical protein